MTEKPPRSWSKAIGSSRVDTLSPLVAVRRGGTATAFEPRRAERDGGVVVSAERLDGDGLAREGRCAPAVARVAAPAPPPRALVVDDDPEVRRALARLLRPELDVWLAGSVAQAEVILTEVDRVDVAFVDWELPDGTGEQILERLAHWPDAIRVLISARVVSSENPLKNRALANLVLGKPVALGVVEALKRAALVLPHG
jgi:CheY-like chemotaxis protein